MNRHPPAIQPPRRYRPPAAGPGDAGVPFTLRDGRAQRLRPIRPDDVDALVRAFSRLTPDQVRQRVFHALTELPVPLAAYMCKVDPETTAAFVATDPHDDEIHGEARIHIDAATDSAEFGIAIDPSFTGQGIGQALMETLIAEARARGVRELWGDILSDNGSMLDLVTRTGFTRQRVPGDPGTVRALLLL